MGRRWSVSRPCSAHSSHCTLHSLYNIYLPSSVRIQYYIYYIIIYCVYRYALQRANVSFVVRSFIQFFSRPGRPCRMTRTFCRDPDSSSTSFSSSGGSFRSGVYILLYILYLYTYVHIRHMHVTLHIIYCALYIKTIPYIPFVFNLIYILYCARKRVVWCRV